MKRYLQRQRGFTVVDAFIIIIVIGAIGAIVVNIVSIHQVQAQDTARRQNIQFIASALQSCHASSCANHYPTLEQLTDISANGFAASNLPRLHTSNLIDPNGNSIQGDEISSVNQYEYLTSPVGCTGTSGDEPCTSFTLKAYQELSPNKPLILDSK